MLLNASDDSPYKVKASDYAKYLNEIGLKIIVLGVERYPLSIASEDFYLQSLYSSKLVDGDIFNILNVLVKDVKVSMIDSTWAATTTFFANCMDLMKPIF
jgi:glycerophosphoryl diester phosphodiesterase